MRKIPFVVFILLVLAAVASGGLLQERQAAVITARNAGGATPTPTPSCDVDITAFTFDNLTGWTQDNGTWSASAGVVYSSPSYQNNFIRNDTTVGATCQWAKLQINDQRTTDSAGSGLVLRATGATGYRYVVRFGGTDGDTKFVVYDATTESQVVEASATITWNDGDYIGARVTGTGNDTVVEVWENPDPGGSTDCPDNWGTADITFSGNPTHPADSGTYVGIFQRSGTYGDYLDNFSAGGE